MENNKLVNNVIRILKIILGLFIALLVFVALSQVIQYIVKTSGGIFLLTLGIDITHKSADNAEVVHNLEATANILAFIGGILGGLQTYKSIVGIKKDNRFWRLLCASLVGMVFFTITVFIIFVSTFVLFIFGINAWAGFAENNIKLFNIIAGFIGLIVGIKGGLRSYKRKMLK